MKVEYSLSFEDHLEARGEHRRVPNGITTTGAIRAVVVLSVCVGLVTWNPISAMIVGSSILIIIASYFVRRYLQRRTLAQHHAALRIENDRFHAGLYTFEADDRGWRLSSIRDEQVHSWDEVQMVANFDRVLYLMTYNGACTLPKAAFTQEQLAPNWKYGISRL